MRSDDRPRDMNTWMRDVEKQLRRLNSFSTARVKVGATALTFDGSGNSTLTHDFGQAPVFVIATHLTGGINILIAPTTATITATQVVLHARNLDGTVFVGGTTVLWQVGI